MPSEVDPARPVVELTAAPGLLSSYRAAALHRGHGGDQFPDKVLRLAGVRPAPAEVARYAGVISARLASTLPPLYPHVLGFALQLALLTDPESPFPAIGLLHVTNSIVAQPISLQARLDIEVEMVAPAPHRRGRTVDLLTRITVGDEQVWRSASTYLHREQGAAVVAASSQPPPPADLLAAPGALWRLPRDLGRRYAAVSGDRNPIHLSGLSARVFGFKSAIAHGMWTAARCLAQLEGRLPERLRDDVEFRAAIPLPGTVAFAHEETAPGQHSYLVKGRNDRLHLLGRITAFA